MNYADLLAPFSWLLIAILGLIILVPYLRGKSELMTSWNFFLVGSICFVGVSGLEAAYQPMVFRIFDYSSSDYAKFLLGATVFFGVLILTYYLVGLPKKLAAIYPRKWPPATTPVLFFTLPFVVLLATLSIFPPPIEGLSQVLVQLGNKAIVFAFVLAFVAWYRMPINVLLLLVLGAVVCVTMVYAVMAGGGRRTLLGVLLVLPVCLYWLRFRHRGPVFNLAAIGGLGAVALVLIGAYTEVRHFDRHGVRLERTFSSSVDALQSVPGRVSRVNMSEYAGQHAVQFSLAAIHLYTNYLEPEPFHAPWFVISNPWPRRLWPHNWPEKPKGLGSTLPREADHWVVTWGPGIVGHGYHEGGANWGPVVLALYAVICGLSMRYFDELLARQPGNPYLLGALCAMTGHIVGWTRGGIGPFTVQIIGCALIALLLCYVGRIVFGTGVVYPRETPARQPRLPVGAPPALYPRH